MQSVSARARTLIAGAVLAAAIATVGAGTPTVASEPSGEANLVPLAPARLLETRSGPGLTTVDGDFEGVGQIRAGTSLEFDVTGRAGVEAGAESVMLNVTAVAPESLGFLTVYPCTDDVPLASNVNYFAGDIVPNNVLAKLSPDGTVCIFSLATTDVIADVAGYVPAGGAPIPVEPARLVETRRSASDVTVDGVSEGIGRLGAGGVAKFRVWDRGQPGDVVPSNAEEVYLNVTAIYPDGPGYLTVYPCTDQVPEVSNVNYFQGDVAPNAVLTSVSNDGHVCIFSSAPADVIADVNAYLPPGGNRQSIQPARCADTRIPDGKTFDGQFEQDGRFGPDDVYAVKIAGRCNIPNGASAVYLNVTALDPSAAGYLTVWPCDEPQPGTSNVNYQAGQIQPNATLSKVSLDGSGQICIYSLAETDVIVDVTGYVPVESPGFVDLAMGTATGCGVQETGDVICWGRHLYGSIPGLDEDVAETFPISVDGLTDAVDIDMYRYSGCVVLDDATARCWGENPNGYLGNGDAPAAFTAHPIAPVVGTNGSGMLSGIEMLDIGSEHTCAALDDGTAACWGRDNYGMLGFDPPGNSTSVPGAIETIPGGRTVVDIAAGPSSTCALLDDTSVLCWGFAADGIYGYLGDGDGDNGGIVMTDDAATAQLTDVVDVEAHSTGYCALRGNGTVWCWGNNTYGQLGDGTFEHRPYAVRVGGITNATAIGGGLNKNCAIAGGAARCWGQTANFGPDSGDDPGVSSPYGLGLPSTGAAVSGSGDTTCWLLSDGHAACAGRNFEMAVGGAPSDGSSANVRQPVYVWTWLAE